MIITPEGLNVFPDDVERVLNAQPGVIESAVVGSVADGQERVHAVLVLAAGRVGGSGHPRGESAAARSSARARILGVDERRAAAHRRDEEAQAPGGSRLGGRAGRGRRSAATGDDPVAAHPRALRGRPSGRRRHLARGSGAELARARRADGRARGQAADARRRNAVRVGADAAAMCARCWSARRRSPTSPSRWTSRAGIAGRSSG